MIEEQLSPAAAVQPTTFVREDDNVRVKPGSDIVAATVADLRTVFRQVINEGGVNLMVVDLEQTQMVDSMGIGLLISAFNSISKTGGRLEIINASAEILSLFRTMRMHQHFRISGK